MKWRTAVLFRVLGIAAAFGILSVSAMPEPETPRPEPSSAEAPAPGRPALSALLDDARAKNEIPALAAVATRADAVLEIAASGIRRQGRPDRVTPQDLFHIGSNTKAMTATLVAILVEQGKLSWTTTPLEVMPELKATMRPEYREITITDLLSHHAGVAPYEDDESPEFRAVRSLKGTPAEQRKEFASRALSRAPAVRPQTKALYSN